MSKNEALRIIRDTDIKNYNWYEEREKEPNEVGIKQYPEGCIVYVTDDRCKYTYRNVFADEADALDEFTKQLVGLKMRLQLGFN